MTKVIFQMNEFTIDLLKRYGYVLDPTHVYWYKKLDDDVEIEIQNKNNDLYIKGQVIIHTKNACIIEDINELKNILWFCKRSDDNVK